MAAQPDRVAVAEVRLTERHGINISVIIPTLNEAEHLEKTLAQIPRSHDPTRIEILISDGGSRDASLQIAADYTDLIVKGSAGRAAQMNRAAALAKGEWLLFLHADSWLPEYWQASILKSRQWGFFPLRLSGQHWGFRVIEKAICLRSAITRVATGDQGLFFRRDVFQQMGGFDDIPIMEDIAISKKARQISTPDIARCAMVTSSRRWQQNGIFKTILLMWSLRLAFWLGISPVRLHRLYYPHHCR